MNRRYCIPCERVRQKEKRTRVKADPDRSEVRRWRERRQLLARRGLNVEQYEAKLRSQQGLCAICGQPETKHHQNGNLKRLAVDHDHATGTVRALLCSACNTMIGLANENPTVLKAAIAYLEMHKQLSS